MRGFVATRLATHSMFVVSVNMVPSPRCASLMRRTLGGPTRPTMKPDYLAA
jgi:hypothetical protein